jgi:hypothetical protein
MRGATMEPKRPTPKKIDNEFLLKSIADHIADAEAQWEAENRPYALSDDIRAAIHKKVVKAWFKLAERGLDLVKGRFSELLVEDNEKWPKAWMVNARGIRERLRINMLQPQANTWAKVMNFLWKKSGSLAESQRLAQFLPEDCRSEEQQLKRKEFTEADLRNIEMGRDDLVPAHRMPQVRCEDRPYAFLTIDTGEMAAETGMSKALCQKYIRAFADAGFIEETPGRTGRPRDGGRRIYAIGYWAGHRDYSHRIPFLIDTQANRNKLAGFSLQQGSLKK